MKVKVKIYAVEDSETKKVYKMGETLDLPEDRAYIAIQHGYVEEVKDGKHNTSKSRKAVTSDNN